MVVSTGRPDVQVPDVAGQPAGEAEAALAAAHLRSRTERVFDNDLPRGLVVGTDPAIGAQAPWGRPSSCGSARAPTWSRCPT